MTRSATEQLMMGVRERREELREAMAAVEHALAAPAPGRIAEWWSGVSLALHDLSMRFADHLELTEADGGLFDEVVSVAPRVAHRVDRLREEHVTVLAALDELTTARAPASVDDADRLRAGATDVICRLARHRQHGADLLYEAYSVDVGLAD